jgi:hypothetical protein
MKYFVILLASVFILSSCKRTEEPKISVVDTTNNAATVLKKAIDSLDKNSMKKHRTALDGILSLPEGGPVPPHLLPAKDIKFLSETDSTATYSFLGGKAGITVKIRLLRVIHNPDTTWIMSGFEEIH